MVFSMMNLEKLEEKAQQVREELAQINTLYSDIISKSRSWSEKRDDLNKKVKNLIVEAKDYRKNRDEVNSLIKNLKSEIKSNNARITEISEKIKSIKEEIERRCKKEKITHAMLRSGSRRKPLPKIRRDITLKLINDYGVSLAETARQLGISTSGVAQIVRRGV